MALTKQRISNQVDNTEDVDVLKPGMVLYYDCGYNCSHPVFLRVLDITKSGQSCHVEGLEDELVDGTYNGYGQVKPVLDKPGRKLPKTFRIQSGYKGAPCIKISSYHRAYVWDGEPKTWTTD